MRPGGLVAFDDGVLGLGQHRDGALSGDNDGVLEYLASEAGGSVKPIRLDKYFLAGSRLNSDGFQVEFSHIRLAPVVFYLRGYNDGL